MNLLAASANETAFWVLAAVVVGVLVLGVLALVATLLYMLRSFSRSLEQLRDAEVELGQARAGQRAGATPSAAAAHDDTSADTGVPAEGAAAPRTAEGEAATGTAEGEAATGTTEPATGAADAQDVERGGTTPG
ncbi:MAG: hypothetical protein ACRDSP_16275 [Pseudonocardiaceae bacterium]